MRTLVERLRDFDGIQTEAADEIDRLQEAKRRAMELADERAREANELALVLKSLATEVRGVWDTFEHDIRHGISNTNYAVVCDKLEEAYRMLAPGRF